MTDEEKIAFYDTRYRPSQMLILQPGMKTLVLRGGAARTCRFCARSVPDATFRKTAHAIPEALGNKWLVSEYECDDCNHLFGTGIEDHLGRWSKPYRTFNGTRGKKGVPTLKVEGEKGWRIEPIDINLTISAHAANPIFSVDDVRQQVDFSFPRETYTPVAVLKAFVKIGLTLMPHEEIDNFHWALSWIRDTEHTRSILDSCIVFRSLVPGPRVRDRVLAFFLWRKDGITDVPYANLVLGYGNEMFQVALPSERDDVINGRALEMPNFPMPAIDDGNDLKPLTQVLDLTGRTPVSDEVVEISMRYESKVPI